MIWPKRPQYHGQWVKSVLWSAIDETCSIMSGCGVKHLARYGPRLQLARRRLLLWEEQNIPLLLHLASDASKYEKSTVLTVRLGA